MGITWAQPIQPAHGAGTTRPAGVAAARAHV